MQLFTQNVEQALHRKRIDCPINFSLSRRHDKLKLIGHSLRHNLLSCRSNAVVHAERRAGAPSETHRLSDKLQFVEAPRQAKAYRTFASPQPSFVPVKCSCSRRTSSRRSIGNASTVR